MALDIAEAAQKADVFPDNARFRPGLAAVVAALGGPTIQKPKRVTMSNWANRQLTPNQVTY